MVGLGQAVLDPIRLTDHVETHWPGICGIAVPRRLGELDVVIGQNRANPIGNYLQKVLLELPRRPPVCLRDQLGDRELAGPVDGREKIGLALGGLPLCDVHVKAADGVGLEALTPGFVPFDIRQM